MSFATYETSAQDGAPIELYEFEVGNDLYCYSTAPDGFTYLARLYPGTQIARSDIEDTGELSKDALTVTVPESIDVAGLFSVAPPSEVVLLSIYRVHFDDPSGERKLIWAGRVLNCSWKGARAELSCESIYTALRRPGLRRLYQRQCPHVLFGVACGANPFTYQQTVTLSGVSGLTLSAADFDAQPDDYFAGGLIEWQSSPGRYERRAIRAHVGTDITITHPIPGIGFGATVTVLPGCAHDLTTCDAKFANSANYGGFPFVPVKNPFGGTNVF